MTVGVLVFCLTIAFGFGFMLCVLQYVVSQEVRLRMLEKRCKKLKATILLMMAEREEDE